MPVYEYRCAQCRHKMSVLVGPPPRLPRPLVSAAAIKKMSRLFSTFAVHKSSLGGLDSLDDAGFGGMDESDPRAMAQMMRSMGGQMDEDMGPEFDEMIDRMEAGEGLDDMDYGGDGSDDFDDFEA